MTRLALLILSVLLLICAPGRAQEGVERFRLDNGVRVTLWPVPSAQTVAVITLFDIGERNDPIGGSGTAHFLEHLLCTAATPESEATTYEEIAARYQGQFNAQTGEDYTLIAFVTAEDRVDGDLRVAVGRLRDLRITQADLDREVPRVELELRNMHDAISILGLLNAAKQAALPMHQDARKGGVIEQVAVQSIDNLKSRLARYYGGANTHLVLVGGFDLDTVRTQIKELFAELPEGEPPPAPAPRLARAQKPILLERDQNDEPGTVCLAFPMPAPSDDRYPAAVLIASRLSELWPPAMNPGAKPFVQWAPLDQPEAMFLVAPIEPGESDEQAIARLDRLVRDAALSPANPTDAFNALQRYGMMLGATPLPPFVAAQNPYFAALVLGRGEQLGTPGPALAVKIRKVGNDALRTAYAAHFAPTARGAAGYSSR
jgi:zinc protease